MTDSAFWRKLAARFKKLDPEKRLRLEWRQFLPAIRCHCEVHCAPGSELIKSEFLSLAAAAGERTDRSDPVTAWLMKIKQNSQNDVTGNGTITDTGTGEETPYIQGVANGVCEASAILCYTFAKQAVEIGGQNLQPAPAKIIATVHGETGGSQRVMPTPEVVEFTSQGATPSVEASDADQQLLREAPPDVVKTEPTDSPGQRGTGSVSAQPASTSESDEGGMTPNRAIELALNSGDRKQAVRLRINLDGCLVKELWSDAFASLGGTPKTKQTAFNRWQASRKDTPSWADGLMRDRLMQIKG